MSLNPMTMAPYSKTAGMRKELGMLVLLLAAETATARVSGDGSIKMEDNTIGTIGVKSMTHCPSADTVSSSAGDTESNGFNTPIPEDDSHAAHTLAADPALISMVMSYLPWRTAITIRGVSRSWFEASMSVVTLCRMPQSGATAAFIPCHDDLDASEEADEIAYTCNHGDTWKCEVCGFWNAQNRIICGNRVCQLPAPSHQDATRIFLGQLRRSGTVSFIKWMTRAVLEDGSAIMNVENHRHKVTGRGKGCAWVYVSNDTSAANLLNFHRRIFLDTIGGVEGTWVVRAEDVAALDAEIETRAFGKNRPRHLPRNSLVVELPSMSSNQYAAPVYQMDSWATPAYSAPDPSAQCMYGALPPPPYHQQQDAAMVGPGAPVRQHQPYATSVAVPAWDGTYGYPVQAEQQYYY